MLFENYLKKNRSQAAHIAYALNKLSMWFAVFSSRIIYLINQRVSDNESTWFVLNRKTLHKKISTLLEKQKKDYPHYSYFYGYPYQGLNLLGIFGERPTEERYEVYKLDSFLSPQDRVLDLGCNCGFVSIYTALRKGCHVTGIDINPYMIDIGNTCADYLKLAEKVKLETCKVQELDTHTKFNGVFSFATHWTDDENYRVNLYDHLTMIHHILEPKGLLFFESHCADLNNPDFLATIDKAEQFLYKRIYTRNTDANTRHYYVFRKI